MREDYTHIVCIIDRSGSMTSIADDTIGGLNTFIQEQASIPGEVRLDIILFDHEYTELYMGDIRDAPVFTRENYVPRGSTALYDAIGTTINNVGAELRALPEALRPHKVIIMILTDGYENSSKQFSAEKIKKMIRHQEDVYNWTFIYLGANQDAFEVGSTLGVQAINTMNWEGTSEGVTRAYDSLSSYATHYRQGSNTSQEE